MKINRGHKNETDAEYAARLRENIAILQYDIKELSDIEERYSARHCMSHSLRDVSFNALQAKEILEQKVELLQDHLGAVEERMSKQETFLEDYREVV